MVFVVFACSYDIPAAYLFADCMFRTCLAVGVLVLLVIVLMICCGFFSAVASANAKYSIGEFSSTNNIQMDAKMSA